MNPDYKKAHSLREYELCESHKINFAISEVLEIKARFAEMILSVDEAPAQSVDSRRRPAPTTAAAILYG